MKYATGGIVKGNADVIPAHSLDGAAAAVITPGGGIRVCYAPAPRPNPVAVRMLLNLFAEIDARTEQRITRMHTNYHRRRRLKDGVVV